MHCVEFVTGGAPLTLSADAWSDVVGLAEPQFVPGRDSVSFIVVDGSAARLMTAPTTGGASRALPLVPPIAPAARSGLGAYGWAPSGDALVYIGANGRLYRHEAESGHTRPLTAEPLQLSGLAVSPTGQEVAVVIDTRRVCVLSLSDPTAGLRVVSEAGDFALDPAWSPDGAILAWHEWDAPHMPWQRSRIVVRRVREDASPTVVSDEGCACGQPRFSPDGRRIGFLSDRNGWMTLWAAPLEGDCAPRLLASATAEHAPPSWGPGLRSWAWSSETEVVTWRNSGGRGALELWSEGVHVGTLAENVAAGGIATRETSVVAFLGGPEATPRIEILQGERRVVAAHSAPAALDRAGAAPRHVSWESEGWTIHARLYGAGRPREPRPLIVWLHEGPTGQASFVLDPRIGYFLERGWAVLAPDYRGSTGWGRDFMRSLYGEWGVAEVADVAAGVEMAIRESWARADRIALYGGSAGGFTALRLLQLRPDLCAAGVALFPVCHLDDLRTPPWRYQEHYVEQLVGGRRAERSPLEHADAILKPVLVLHGSEDGIVPAWHSEALVEAVNAAGGSAERRLYEGEGHGWTGGPTLADELRTVECFLNRVVLRPDRR